LVTSGPTYDVRLAELNFEGPLDLLLFLIKKNEIEVTDIPIALVAEQFLAYVERITAENLDPAGDFLLMAATLLRIKAQMLLPAPLEQDGEELEDPRSDLVNRLLEYQQYKEVADRLREHEAHARLLFPRGAREMVEALETTSDEPPERRVTLNDLLRAFARVLDAREAEPVHHVDVVRVTLEERVRHVRSVLAERGWAFFHELFPAEASRIEVVVTLIALLEMVRNLEVRLRQGGNFDDIQVLPREPVDDS
jgi:segregation and condensation protein A